MNLLKNFNPTISIIIPVYNVEKYLKNCIESVIKSNYKNKEIILINDGSTDKSGEICNEYSKTFPFIRTIHQMNSGLSNARNKGVIECIGDYVIFLDSDDKWTNDFISDCMDKCVKEDEIYDLIIGSAEKVWLENDDHEYIGKHFDCKKIDGKNGKEVLSYILKIENDYEWYAWRYLISKKLLVKNNIKFPENLVYEDAFTIYKVFLCAQNVGYIDSLFLEYYSGRPGSILNVKNSKQIQDRLKIADLVIEDIGMIPDEKLKIALKQNFSELFLGSYSDYLDDEKLSTKLIKKNMCILEYNNSRFGKIVWVLYRFLGFEFCNNIIKLMLKIHRRNKLL